MYLAYLIIVMNQSNNDYIIHNLSLIIFKITNNKFNLYGKSKLKIIIKNEMQQQKI